MRILITNTGPWGTGSFTVAEAIIKEYRKLGHDVLLFFPDSQLDTPSKEHYYKGDAYYVWKFPITIEGYRFPSFPLIIPDPHPRSDWNVTYKDLDETVLKGFLREQRKRIKHVVQEFKPDVIECQHIWYMNYTASELDIPFFSCAHHSDQMGFHYDPRVRKYAIESAQRSQKVFAISNYVSKEVQRLYHLEEDHVVTVPNGYDKDVFFDTQEDRKAVLQQLNIHVPDDAILVSFAGKISRTKGVDILLHAMKRLEKTKIHVLALGGGDPKQFIKDKMPKGFTTKNVHFVGHRAPETVAKIHNISHFSVLPSRTEGFGIACLEAMGCGLPLVVTTTGGLKEYAVGELVEVEDIEGLKRAIEKLATLPEKEYEALCNKALQAAANFSWEQIAKLRLSCYKDALRWV